MSEVTAKPRKAIAAVLKKKLKQEANSMCPFCGNSEPGTWEFHHIDSDRGNSTYENMIMVCGGCHDRITKGELSEADVRLKKTMIMWKLSSARKKTSTSGKIKAGNLALGNTGCKIEQNVYIDHMPPPRVKAAPDSIGANAKARNYANYLARKLCEYRMKDKIFSTEEERKHAQKNYMAAIWKKVKNDFKVTSYHAVSMENREELFQHFKTLIDKTKQGKMNKGRGIKSYFLFEEYDG